MINLQSVTVFSTLIFGLMLVLMEVGRQLGRRQIRRDAEGARAGTGAVEGAIFALLGLVIAFTFSGAATRFDLRRQLILRESNAIGTAWLRLDVLPEPHRAGVRQLFREYLDARLATYRAVPDLAAAKARNQEAKGLQTRIWKACVEASRAAEGPPATMLLLPALNEMFDIEATRMAVIHYHPPIIIFVMLGFLATASSLVAGYGMGGAKHRSWFHMLAFSCIIGLSIYLILDLEYPRLGLIRVDKTDQLLLDVRKTME